MINNIYNHSNMQAKENKPNISNNNNLPVISKPNQKPCSKIKHYIIRYPNTLKIKSEIKMVRLQLKIKIKHLPEGENQQ